MAFRNIKKLVSRTAAGLIAVALSVAPIFTSPAQGEVERLGNGNFMAGIPASVFTSAVQKNSYWCWAACIQMCLNTQGVAMEQTELVTRVFGHLIDAPADDAQIIDAVHGEATTFKGEQVELVAHELDSFSAVLEELGNNRPVIAGMANTGDIGHAQVLMGVEYGVDEFGDRIAKRAILRDPRNGSRVEIPWGEFRARTFFMLAVVARRA